MTEWKGYVGKQNKQAYSAYQALKANELQKECFEHLQHYLNSLCLKKKSEEWVFNSIFSRKAPKCYELANIYAANVTLTRVLKRASLTDFQNPIIKEFLDDFVCDLKEYIGVVDPHHDYAWLILNTNQSLSHFYYDEVLSLLYGEQMKSTNSDAKFNLATLAIRHALEQRIRNLIGLDYLLINNQPIMFSTVLEVLTKLQNLKKQTSIDINRLRKINDWANRHLHRGLRPLTWQMEWAENEIGKLFFIGKTIDEQSLSLFASFETDDLSELREEFEHQINLNYPGKNIQIKWSLRAEINISAKVKGGRNG